jgi:thiol-disulfide isomerase/thioredoxin
MKRSGALLSVLVILFLVASCSLTASVKAQNEVAWVYDYPTGMKEAAEKNRPAMIYIHEQWCPRCRSMDQNTWNNSEVVALSSSFVNINVVGTEQGTLYNYSKPPLIVFTDPQGKVIVKQNAELSAREVTALQRQVLAQAPFPSPSPTPNPSNTPAPTANTATVSPSTSAKAVGVPGFEATFSVACIVIVAFVLSRIGQRFQ